MRLIQEDLKESWKILVANILLNRTRGIVVRSVLKEVFRRWPFLEDLRDADVKELEEVLRPCGLQRRKASLIKKMLREFAMNGFSKDLPGIGRYAIESWRIFVLGERDFVPEDKQLRLYLKRVNGSDGSDNDDEDWIR